jgi:hypothetical protein
VFDGGEACGCIIGAAAAFVVTEHPVHDPMKAVLNHPMAADSWRDPAILILTFPRVGPGWRGDFGAAS